MRFNEKLKNLRKGKNITQEKLAESLNVSRQAVSKWESGDVMPEIDKIVELAKMYDISLDYLLTDKTENPHVTDQKANKVYDEPKSNKFNKIFIAGIVFFSTGFIGVLVFVVLAVLNHITVMNGRGIHTGFGAFLEATNLLPLFVLCCICSLTGLFMMMDIRNHCKKILNVWRRQHVLFKYGIVVFILGLVIVFIILFFTLNYTEVISPGIAKSSSINPVVFLPFSIIVPALGLFMMIIGFTKSPNRK